MASAYGFAQADAKTPDGYFLGFPSYWNVAALYLVELRPPVAIGVWGVVVLSLLTFVPLRYLYPSQPGWLNRVTAALGGVWGAVVVLALLRVPQGAESLAPCLPGVSRVVSGRIVGGHGAPRPGVAPKVAAGPRWPSF